MGLSTGRNLEKQKARRAGIITEMIVIQNVKPRRGDIIFKNIVIQDIKPLNWS
jgi:hypothetical protein